MHVLAFSCIFLHVLAFFAFSCIFFHFHFLSFSFMFLHFLAFSLIFVHFPAFPFIFFHFFKFLPFSFSFFQFRSFFLFLSFLLVLLFLGCTKKFFCLNCLTISYYSSYVKNQFFVPSRGSPPPLGPLFSLVYFSCFFIFVFLSMLFLYFPFVFLLKKMFLPFSCCFSFFFSRVLKICGGTSGFLGESALSELALFALYWLVVTFHCGIVHILVMIRLRES